MTEQPKPRIGLVDDWRNWWRWGSTRFAALAVLFQSVAEIVEHAMGVWSALPPESRDVLPSWLRIAALICGLLVIVARVLKLRQPKTGAGDDGAE